jgi:hypothetical protein
MFWSALPCTQSEGKLWTALSNGTCSTAQYSGCPHLISCSPCFSDVDALHSVAPREAGLKLGEDAEVTAPFDWGDTEDYSGGNCLFIADKENIFLPQVFPAHVGQLRSRFCLPKASPPLSVPQCSILLWDVFCIETETTFTAWMWCSHAGITVLCGMNGITSQVFVISWIIQVYEVKEELKTVPYTAVYALYVIVL